jgi:hypothetical protein
LLSLPPDRDDRRSWAEVLFRLTTRAASWLRLSRRDETWKIAEILTLRHQLAVLQRRQLRRPKLTWADRALLVTLPGVIPKARRQGLRLLVTPITVTSQIHRILAVIEHASRRIRILGVTLHPTGEWTAQQARNLLMDLDEQAHRVRFMIRDRSSNPDLSSGLMAAAGVRGD